MTPYLQVQVHKLDTYSVTFLKRAPSDTRLLFLIKKHQNFSGEFIIATSSNNTYQNYNRLSDPAKIRLKNRD